MSASWQILRVDQESPQRKLNTDLLTASIDGRVTEVAGLIQKKANVNFYVKHGPTNEDEMNCLDPLLTIVGLESRKNVKCSEVMKLLIGAKADINAPDNFGGSSVVMTMIVNRCQEALGILLENQVDLSDWRKELALHLTKSLQLYPEGREVGGTMERMIQSVSSKSDQKDNKQR